MRCDACRERDAVYHLTRIEADGPSTTHLCERCAAERGISATLSVSGPDGTTLDAGVVSGDDTAALPLTCPGCGTTLVDLQAIWRVGCATCWTTFGGALGDAVRRIHGSTRHVGKGYGGVLTAAEDSAEGLRREQERLHVALRAAVATERFEDAAVLRDQLRMLGQ